MSSSSSSNGSGITSPTRRPLDPIARTALRYTISPREYELLHQYLISRAPRPVQKRAPEPKRYAKLTAQTPEKGKAGRGDATIGPADDSNVVALRSAVRVFAAVYLGFKGYELVIRKLSERRGSPPKKGVPFGNARLALSFSSILLVHKLLHRFFKRLRTSLLSDEASAARFRKRNPRVSRVLASATTPALGAALSGLCLGISPADQLRVTIAIYLFARSLEFSYNALELNGSIWKGGKEGKPWWFGSWMLMPFACGQLLHAFVFDRDCFPADYGAFILKRSPEYMQTRPKEYPVGAATPWPSTFSIVDALAQLSKLNWPPFLSPILYPSTKETLPASLAHLSPVTSGAHPGLKYTSCALLHPHTPSCSRTYVTYFFKAFPMNIRTFTLIYGAFSLLAIRSAIKAPLTFMNKLAERILRMAVFITGAIGTSWASICAFNRLLSPRTLSTQRFFLGGFIGGIWAFIARERERGNFLYSARLSLDSFYKVGRKRGWWKGITNGDVLLFTASLALVDYVYQTRPDAVQGAAIRKAVSVMRGEGWRDSVEPEAEAGKEELKEQERNESVLGESTVVVDGEEGKKEV